MEATQNKEPNKLPLAVTAGVLTDMFNYKVS